MNLKWIMKIVQAIYLWNMEENYQVFYLPSQHVNLISLKGMPLDWNKLQRWQNHKSFSKVYLIVNLIIYPEMKYLDVPLEVRIKGERISGLCHPTISHL